MSTSYLDLDEDRYIRQLEVTHANGWHPEHDVEDCPRCTVERSGEGRTPESEGNAMSESLYQASFGTFTVELERSLNVIIRQGDTTLTVTNVEGLRTALADALDARTVAEAVARDQVRP